MYKLVLAHISLLVSSYHHTQTLPTSVVFPVCILKLEVSKTRIDLFVFTSFLLTPFIGFLCYPLFLTSLIVIVMVSRLDLAGWEAYFL